MKNYKSRFALKKELVRVKRLAWIYLLVIVIVSGFVVIQHIALLNLLDANISQTDLEYAYNNDYKIQAECSSYSLRFNK